MASPSSAVIRVVEFGVACAGDSSPISFIELLGGANELLDPRIGIRTLDHSGTVLWENPILFYGYTNWRWIENRRFAIMTTATLNRLTPPIMIPDIDHVPMGVPLDPVGGSIILYRSGTGAPVTVDRVDYGPGRASSAPPPGTSMTRTSLGWRIEPAPRVNTYNNQSLPPASWSELGGCLGVPAWTVSGIMTRCDDGSLRSQYIQLRTSTPGRLDPQVLLRCFDRNRKFLGEFPPFALNLNCPEDGRWLVGTFDAVTTGSADAALPLELDPLGGTIEVSGMFGGVPWTQDVFTYGTVTVPAPPPGYAYDRTSQAMILPAPLNFDRVRTVPLQCGYGSDRASFIFRELSLACASGSSVGQFVELGVMGGGTLALDDTFELRAFDRDGLLQFTMPGAFSGMSSQTLDRGDAVLISGPAPRSGADVTLPDLLDPVAGRLVLLRDVAGVPTVVAKLAWGDGTQPPPADGTSLVAEDGFDFRPASFPTPTGLRGPAPLADCEFRDGPPAAVVRQIGLTCRDGSGDGLFLELHAPVGTQSIDSNLGLDLVAMGGSTTRIFPLFPPGFAGMAMDGHRLLAKPGFEARTQFTPDHLLPADAPLPMAFRIFRRDPLTGADRVLTESQVPMGSLTPGHGFARDVAGRYFEIVAPRPIRADGATLESSGCFPTSRPDAVRIREVLLRSRDGSSEAQYVELESTDSDAVTSPALSLRAFDRDGVRSFDTKVPPVWPGASEPPWPQDLVLLAGAAAAQARYGISTDLALPMALDSLAGRLELVLDENGSERVVHSLAYGTSGVPTPPAGTTLSWTPDGFVVNDQPTPQNSHGEDARRDGLGLCADRELVADGRQRYVGGDAVASVAFGGARARYDARRGTFHLESGASMASARMPDRYRVIGVPPGTPIQTVASVSLAASVTPICHGSLCIAPRARLFLGHGGAGDSTVFHEGGVRLFGISVHVLAGEAFDVELGAAVSAGDFEGESATLDGRLEFPVLPEGARVVSCLGYDSERARPVREPRVEPLTNGVRLTWVADPTIVQRATLERSTETDTWQSIATQAPDAGGTLEFVDARAERGRDLAYRVRWDDLFGPFGTHVTPEVHVTLDPAPGFALDGVHPNPSTGLFAASVRIPEAGVVRLEALDIAGRVVASQSMWRAAGIHEVPLAEHGRLAPGVYVVRLHYRGMVSRTTAVVLR